MKKTSLLAFSLACILLVSCEKRCVCLTRNGANEVSFTEDELDDRHVSSCTRMADYPVEGHYIRCEWD